VIACPAPAGCAVSTSGRASWGRAAARRVPRARGGVAESTKRALIARSCFLVTQNPVASLRANSRKPVCASLYLPDVNVWLPACNICAIFLKLPGSQNRNAATHVSELTLLVVGSRAPKKPPGPWRRRLSQLALRLRQARRQRAYPFHRSRRRYHGLWSFTRSSEPQRSRSPAAMACSNPGVRSYTRGLRAPRQANATVNAPDPVPASSTRLPGRSPS